MTQPRIPQPTISFIDKYCSSYQKIFPEVRSYEAFKQIIMGILTSSRRKSLAAISKIIGLKNSQSLHNFLTKSPWRAEELRAERLKIIWNWLKEEAIDIIIDETGDPKKGNKTEYVTRQYLGRLGKVDNGIVSVNIYGVTNPETLPANSTSYVMTNIKKIRYQDVGNIYGERTWVEYGFRQSKSELGWSDFHLTKYNDIAKWWEVICCAFVLVSLTASFTQFSDLSTGQSELKNYLAEHPNWDVNQGWKSMLNNVQLLLLPLLALKLVEPWLKVFENPLLVSSFNTLISLVNLCANALAGTKLNAIYSFSSA
jgi:SRSO17 transposase